MVTVEEGCQEGAQKRKAENMEGVDEDCGEKKDQGSNRSKKMVAGIKEKVGVHDGEKDDVKRPVETKFHAKLGLLTD